MGREKKLKKEEKKYCCFEIWDKERKVIVACGSPAVYRYKKQKKYLCEEHTCNCDGTELEILKNE